jgi:hypothetical protein
LVEIPKEAKKKIKALVEAEELIKTLTEALEKAKALEEALTEALTENIVKKERQRKTKAQRIGYVGDNSV